MTVFADYCVDFDGVLHEYLKPWAGARVIEDGAVPGAILALCRYIGNGEKVAIYSARSGQWGGRRAMRRWLTKQAQEWWLGEVRNGDVRAAMDASRAVEHHPFAEPDEEAFFARALVRAIAWPRVKPAAKVYIDDRGYRFTGTFPEPGTAADLIPWNRDRGVGL